MTFNQLKIQMLFLFSFELSAMANAGTPVWSFTPSQLYPPSAVLISPDESATVQYTVTNNSSSPHSLYMVPIQGITPTVTGCASSPSCIAGAEFCLPGKNSTCTLTLAINSSQLLGNVTTGPELCQYGQTKQGPSKQQCYTPANPLNITLVSYPPTTLSVSTRTIIPVNAGSGSLTVTNTGAATAYGVSAQLSSLTCSTSYLDITQNSNDCATIPAGQSCTLSFTSTTPCLAKGNIPIVGLNISNNPTTALAFSIGIYYLVFALSSESAPSTPQVVDLGEQFPRAWYIFSGTPSTNLTDGFSNTQNIAALFASGAANECYSINVDHDWYLPAICQLGGAGQGAGCTNSNETTIDNLVQLGFITFTTTTEAWSSSISVPNTTTWNQTWAAPSYTPSQVSLNWSAIRAVRCARSLNY